MAIGKVGKSAKVSKEDESGYLSDESDFYGDESTKLSFSERASSFDVSIFWQNTPPSLTSIANTHLAKRSNITTKPTHLYNPYEGQFSGRQLTETINEFLQRLPPSTTPQSDLVPWIYIANPYRKESRSRGEDGSQTVDLTGQEAPPDEESDWAQFVVRGGKMLEELKGFRIDTERKNKGKAKSAVTKVVNAERDRVVKRILEVATELKCTSGKWLLFATSSEVDAIWSVVAKATASNDLGVAAKVAPDDGEDRRPRVICIYTQNFNDLNDVERVVNKMRDLGLVEMNGRAIHYKCDAYTYLGIGSGNEYNIKASLYSSAEILKPKDQRSRKDGKVTAFFK